jgi:8-oxo-dGTP diphosphatase
MNHEDFIPVTAAVIVKEGKVLIAKRRRAVMGYSWEFPGGKLEDGETLEECLKREISEELGIVIEVGEELCASTHALSCRTTIRLFAFVATHVCGEFRLTDHEEIRWVTPPELDAYDFPEPDRPIVAALKQRSLG